jgi:hypothetical protein
VAADVAETGAEHPAAGTTEASPNPAAPTPNVWKKFLLEVMIIGLIGLYINLIIHYLKLIIKST